MKRVLLEDAAVAMLSQRTYATITKRGVILTSGVDVFRLTRVEAKQLAAAIQALESDEMRQREAR